MAGSRRRARRKARAASSLSWIALLGVAVLLGVLGGGVLWLIQNPAGPAEEEASPAAPVRKAPPPAPTESPERFEFYAMLPDAEVAVPGEPRETVPGGPPPVTTPGTYVVQAGAFPAFAEADRVRARLMLLNVTSQIQEAEADGATFHRVRIGPIDNLDELNRLRTKLRQNKIDFIVIPVGE